MDQLSLKQRLVDPLQAESLQRDVTFVCADQVSHSFHQCVLASYSPVLRGLLKERACCACKSASCGGLMDVVIILEGFNGEVVMNLMKYIYTGEVQVKNRKMILEMIELKKVLGMHVEIDFSVNKKAPVKDFVSDESVVAKAAQKRVTLAIMNAIEQVNSGVSKILCTECDQCLNKASFMLHYRNHMQVYSQSESGEQVSSNTACNKCGTEVGVEVFDKHSCEIRHDKKMENFSDFLKKKCSNKSVKTETRDDDGKSIQSDDFETVMQSHDDPEIFSNIDMQEYEKLLRSNIHNLIVTRKKRKAKEINEQDGLILVSQQEIDEEILKNPRNKEEEYGRLKVRQVYRRLYDRKLKLKIKDKTDSKDPVVVTDEEIQDEFDKENITRTVKVNLDVQKIKSVKQKSCSPLNLKIPSTPRRGTLPTSRQRTPRVFTPPAPRRDQNSFTPQYSEGERKKIYHKLYVLKWDKNQEKGLTDPIQVTEEEILEELYKK